MARGLGCIEYADGTRRYFVHCETSGGIFRALFDSPAGTQATYRKGDVEGLIALRGSDRRVEVVKFALISGWDDQEQVLWQFDRFGLATSDTFIGASPDIGQNRCLQVVNGTLHVAELVNGGFSGDYDVPLCHLREEGNSCDYNPEAKEFGYSEWFGKSLGLCPKCVAALLD